jgi:hypothetical protein
MNGVVRFLKFFINFCTICMNLGRKAKPTPRADSHSFGWYQPLRNHLICQLIILSGKSTLPDSKGSYGIARKSKSEWQVTPIS